MRRTNKKHAARNRIATEVRLDVLYHPSVAMVVRLSPSIVDLAQRAVAEPIKRRFHFAVDVCPRLNATITVEVGETTSACVRGVAIHHPTVVGTSPLDHPEHVLRISKEL